MKKRTLKAETPQFLSGWKEIANFLGMGVRTVQRYERELGLPVRRPAGKVRGSVVSVKAELDGWVKASPIRQMFHLRESPSRSRPRSQDFLKHLSELATLREQMSTLRVELEESVARLRESVEVLQGEVLRGEQIQQEELRHRTKFPSEIYSQEEHDLLVRIATITAAMSFPKAS